MAIKSKARGFCIKNRRKYTDGILKNDVVGDIIVLNKSVTYKEKIKCLSLV